MKKYKVTTWSALLGQVCTYITAKNKSQARRCVGGSISSIIEETT